MAHLLLRFTKHDWADLLEIAARADLIRCDPREDKPTAVRNGTGRTNLFDIPTSTYTPPQNKLMDIRMDTYRGHPHGHHHFNSSRAGLFLTKLKSSVSVSFVRKFYKKYWFWFGLVIG